MVSIMVFLLSTKYFLFVYMYMMTDLLKFQAYKLVENSDADLAVLASFLKKPTCILWSDLYKFYKRAITS